MGLPTAMEYGIDTYQVIDDSWWIVGWYYPQPALTHSIVSLEFDGFAATPDGSIGGNWRETGLYYCGYDLTLELVPGTKTTSSRHRGAAQTWGMELFIVEEPYATEIQVPAGTMGVRVKGVAGVYFAPYINKLLYMDIPNVQAVVESGGRPLASLLPSQVAGFQATFHRVPEKYLSSRPISQKLED